MPRRPLGPCRVRTCPNRADCPIHAQRAPAPPRPTRQAQGYGAEWQKTRREFLSRYPMCLEPGCFAPATQVDHIIPKARGGTDDWANLQALCHSHHSQKTAREMRRARSVK